MSQRTADETAGGDKGAFCPLAVIRAMLRMIAAAMIATFIAMGGIVVGQGKVALAPVRMMHAAAHHQVDDQRRGD